jgi:hypothetical protein
MIIPASSRPRYVRWLVLATVGVFLALVVRFWHPVYGFTAFFQLDASNDEVKLAAFRELPVYVYRDTGGYDGLYYAQLALDPTLRDPALPRAMDNFAYRARRILPPALAWLVGAGRPAGVILAYSLLNVVAWLVLGWLVWRLLRPYDGRPDDWRRWATWTGVMFSAGALSSVRLALTDLPALVIVAAAVLAAEEWRGRLAVALLGVAGVARETALVAVAGLCKPPWWSVKNVARLVLVVAPLAAWLGYVRWRAGPADAGWGNFTWPLVGLAEKWRAVVIAAVAHEDRPLAWTTLLATLGLTVQASFFVVRRDPGQRWWRLGAAYTVLALCLGTAVWEGFPGAATRVLLPLTLAFNIVVQRTRAPLGWLLAGNLTVFSGLLALRDVPHDPTEMAAIRTNGVAGIAHVGAGWHGREQAGRHVWAWTARGGTIVLETWPKSQPVNVALTFGLRSLAPCNVRVRQDGREVGRFTAGPQLITEHLPLTISGGRAQIEFVTDASPLPENTSPGARPLAFALYDLRLGVLATPE